MGDKKKAVGTLEKVSKVSKVPRVSKVLNMKDKKIYVLHGWAYSTEKWEPFIEELTKGGYEVEMLKIPGLTAPLEEVWELDDYIKWLRSVLDNEKNKIILLGHSNGGRILIAFAAKYPDKVKQIFLIDSAGIYHNELPIRLKRLVFGSAAKIGKKLTSSPSLKKLFYKFAREHDYEQSNSIVKKTMVNLINSDLINIFSNIKIPTVIIWGENDKITPLSDGKVINEKIKNSKLYIIPDSRHSPMFNHPRKVADIIIENL